MRTAGLLALIALAACGGSDPAEGVHPGVVEMIDTLETQGDCASLQARFDDFDDAPTLGYINNAMEDAGCYDD